MISVASPPSLPSIVSGDGWRRKGPCRSGSCFIVVGGRIETVCDCVGKGVPDGSCFTKAVTYLCWYSYKTENSRAEGEPSCSVWSRFASTNSWRAWIYVEGTDLCCLSVECSSNKVWRYVRILRKVRTEGINVSTLCESVYGQWSPVRSSLSQREGSDFTFS